MKMPLHALCKGLLCGLLLFNLNAAAAGPAVSTLPATEVSALFTNAAASLNAAVNPNGQPSDAWFEFGTTASYGQVTLRTNLGSGSGSLSIRFDLSGLIAGRSYHYRCVASNVLGLVSGADEVFSAPLVSLNGANPFTNACNTSFVDPGAAAITDVSAFRAIAAGGNHSLILLSNGHVLAWGWNAYQQTSVPSDLSGVYAIAAGSSHSIALLSNGTVRCWGWNYYGQTTPQDDLTNAIAIAGGGQHSLALRSDGTVVGWGLDSEGQATPPADLSNVVRIAAGYMHSVALTKYGGVRTWGDTSLNQGAVPSNLTNVMAVACGENHTLALLSNGTVVAWGDYISGQLEVPSDLTNVIAISAGAGHSLALKSDGTIVAWGDSYYGQCAVPTGLTNAIAVAAGVMHNLALTADGNLTGWGLNNYSQAQKPGLPVFVTGTVDTQTEGSYLLTYAATNTLGAVGTATRTVIVACAAPEQPHISHITLQADHKVLLEFFGRANTPFRLQTTTNLINWDEITLLPGTSDGLFQYLDTGTNAPGRFYRLKWP
jgi:alpha-tubulin suppressor-like RCC1 family protein